MGIKHFIYTIFPHLITYKLSDGSQGFTYPTRADCQRFSDDLKYQLKLWVPDEIEYFCFQVEEGEQGTPHAQLFVRYAAENTRGSRIERLLDIDKSVYHGVEQRWGNTDDV